MKKLIVANWKMNGSIVENSKLLLSIIKHREHLKDTEVVICPPAIYIQQVKEYLAGTNIVLGAQHVNANKNGAYTGEISISMLQEFACRYVLVGHSERRSLYHETQSEIAFKVTSLVENKLTPILCVGETLAQRESGETKAIIIKQLGEIITAVGKNVFSSVVIAYEPIWAIGTGITASPKEAQQIHNIIRSYLTAQKIPSLKRTVILYGGSVNESNTEELIKQKDIDGFLVGGASLKADSFQKIYSS